MLVPMPQPCCSSLLLLLLYRSLPAVHLPAAASPPNLLLHGRSGQQGSQTAGSGQAAAAARQRQQRSVSARPAAAAAAAAGQWLCFIDAACHNATFTCTTSLECGCQPADTINHSSTVTAKAVLNPSLLSPSLLHAPQPCNLLVWNEANPWLPSSTCLNHCSQNSAHLLQLPVKSASSQVWQMKPQTTEQNMGKPCSAGSNHWQCRQSSQLSAPAAAAC
jgi:hypothetical protein